jgi:hypothetical protein
VIPIVRVALPALIVIDPDRAAPVFRAAVHVNVSPEAPLLVETVDQSRSEVTDQVGWFVVIRNDRVPPAAGAGFHALAAAIHRGGEYTSTVSVGAGAAVWVMPIVRVALPALIVIDPDRAAPVFGCAVIGREND